MITKFTFFFLLNCLIVSAIERPNLIFILTDDQRRDSLPCYGNSFAQTPHLDQLARDGTVFDNASVTSAICTPSRVSFFTGQYERKHGVNFNSGTALSPQAWAKTYPIVLREAGYFTGYVGKNHVPIGEQGYRTGLMEKSFDYWFAGHGHLKFYPKKSHQIFHHTTAQTQVEVIDEVTRDFLSTDEFIEGAHSFLSRRDQTKPFCLSICFNLPHDSGTSTMKQLPTDDTLYRTTYRDRLDQIPLPSTYRPRSEIQTPKLPADLLFTQYRQNVYDYVDTPARLRERMVRRYQTITGIDRMIGALREKLASLKLTQKTVIIFTSDHGIMLGEHGLGGKALNYEPCLQVPLIVYDPKRPGPQRLSSLVQSIDIAPTLLDYASATIPSSIQGHSLRPLIEGKKETIRHFAFAENLWSNVFGNPRVESLKGPRFKYIRYFKNTREHWEGLFGTKKQYRVTPAMRTMYQDFLEASITGEAPVYEELFDLEQDPHERLNLATQDSHQATLKLFRQQCQAHVTIALGDSRDQPTTVPLPLKP